jgi:hypothetical protein
MCWDDHKQNNSQVGDIFGFYKGNVCVEIHRVDAVQDPSHRLSSWSNNVGLKQGRNVLVLSSLLCGIPWSDWVTFGWHTRGPLLGTQRVANDQARVHMIRYISAVLQRTQGPGIFPLGSQEGGAGIDKGAGAGSRSVAGGWSGWQSPLAEPSRGQEFLEALLKHSWLPPCGGALCSMDELEHHNELLARSLSQRNREQSE